jgi:tetratricopeptide (TPR) repeat protein
MSSSARIDELRKKFDENPRRYFAPLANEYRKAGDFEQAVFICQEYLPQQPGHMSGHIVYGQTLFDMGRDEEAKAVFETALTLDPENLIALKHLGDIARQAGDIDGARSWYQRVLEADPRNDEIMQVLESIGGADIGLGAASVPEVPSRREDSALSFGEIAPSDLESSIEPSYRESDSSEELVLEQSVDAELPVAELAAVEPEPPPFTPSDEPVVQRTAEADAEAPVPELLDLDDFSIGEMGTLGEDVPESEPEAEPVVAGAGINFDSDIAEPADEGVPTDDFLPAEPGVELATDMILGLPDDSPESSSDQHLEGFEAEAVPATGEDLSRAIDQLEGLETFSIDAPPVVSASDTVPDDAATDDTATPAAPDTFATETMADLYAQQGHFDSALEIYAQLLERSPDDAELRRRASEIERQLSGAAEPVAPGTVDLSVAPSLADTVEFHASIEIPTPTETGPTIRDFFKELLEGRRVDEVGAEAPADNLGPVDEPASSEPEGSLDILFSDVATTDADHSAAMSLAQAFSGEAEGDDSAALRGTPAHPATDELSLDHVFRSVTPAKGSGAANAFSLDQFFAGEVANADTPEGSSEGAPRATEDIAQFNAWLNGLKKT